METYYIPEWLKTKNHIYKEETTMTLITLAEWAEREGIHPATARRKAGNGMLATARKVGRDWMIDSSETNKDNRELPNKKSIAERRQMIFVETGNDNITDYQTFPPEQLDRANAEAFYYYENLNKSEKKRAVVNVFMAAMGKDGDPIDEFEENGIAWSVGSDYFDLEAHIRLKDFCAEVEGNELSDLGEALDPDFYIDFEDDRFVRVRLKGYEAEEAELEVDDGYIEDGSVELIEV